MKKKKNTIDTTDRISMLPDSIVHHILSYLLDDPKSCVRMSVLSKGWFTLTASFPILYFHLDGSWFWSFSRKYDHEYITEKFYKYVEYTVSRFCEQNISAHTLNIFAEIINLEEIELFERCLDLVLEKGLQMMDIHLCYDHVNLPMFRLPNTLLSASSLTSLTLHKCELPPSLMIGVVKFKSLRLLSLSYLPVDEGVIECLTNGCPVLEEIYLRYCYGFKTFCVKWHQNLLKLEIYSNTGLERIDVDAPNLSYFLLVCNKDKAPSLSLDSCKKLKTFCYRGIPLKSFSDLLSNFPFIENLCLELPSHVNNLKLSNHSLRRLELESHCDLEEIDLNTPSLLLFEYFERPYGGVIRPLSRKHSSMSKGCMKCVTRDSHDILWYQKLRKFMEKNSIFKVLKLVIRSKKRIGVQELKLFQSSPYELEHVKLKHHKRWETQLYVALVDAVLWCFRPRTLTLKLDFCTDTSHVAKYTYEKLIQQEDKDQTNIKFVMISSSKDEKQFSDLNSLLKALSLDQSIWKITFIKEEAVQEAG